MKRAGLIVPLMIVAASCDTPVSGGGGSASPPTGAESVPAGVALALLTPNAGGATAAASGRLAVRGRCLVLEAGGERINLAFATAQTRWDSAAGALRIGERTFRPGERIEVGGAMFEGDPAVLPWLRAPEAGCGERLWIVSSIGPE